MAPNHPSIQRGLYLVVTFLAFGCDPSLQGGGPATGAWVELLTGDIQAESLSDNQVLAVERGSQGGVHIYGSLRAGGIARGSEDEYEALLSGDRPLVEFILAAEYGVLSNSNVVREFLPLDDSGDLYLVGRRVIFRHYSELPEDWQELDWAEVEERLEEDELTFRVQITDSRGRFAEDSKTIRLDFPPRELSESGK
jgi:hypothetical protein